MTAFNIVATFATLYVAFLSIVINSYQQSSALKSAAVDVDTKAALATAANEARGLAMDSIAAAHSGHMGLPLGAAEIGATLYGLEVS
jgi:transketolase